MRITERHYRVAFPALLGLGAAAGALALRLRDPHVPGSWGVCPFRALLGLDCPGCGTLRAVNDLTHGDLLAAASSNLLFTVAVPFMVLGWALWLRRAWLGPRAQGAAVRRPHATPPRWASWLVGPAVAVVVLGFTVLRNLPAGAWLHS